MEPSAPAGAPPKVRACASMGSSFRLSTGKGRPGMAWGSLLKNWSFSALSLTARFSRKAIVSTSLFLRTLLSASLDGFKRLAGCELSRRW